MEIVYVVHNQEMPGLVKVGKTTTQSIEDRVRGLDGTSIPVPFECLAAWEVEDAKKAEAALHKAFEDRRVRKKGEFFRVSAAQPIAILEAFGIRDVTPRDDVVDEANPDADRAALERSSSRRENFRFSMVGIAPGSSLESVWDETETCEVLDDRKIKFVGEETTLSNAALKVLHGTGKMWKRASGPESWTWEGRTLASLRDEP